MTTTTTDTQKPTMTNAMTLFSMLYPKVRLQPGVKIKLNDKDVYRTGTTLPNTEDSAGLMLNYRKAQERGCRWLTSRRGTDFEAAVGRPMTADDMRLAVRPVMDMQIAAFLDDVTANLAAHLKIETSPGSWHAHFILDRLCDADEIVKIQKYLRFFFGGDPAAIKKLQPRRIPVPGLGAVVNLDLPLFSADALLLQYSVIFPATAPPAAAPTLSGIFGRSHQQALSGQASPVSTSAFTTTTHYTSVDLSDAVLSKLWLRRLSSNSKSDKSSADFGLAVYLLKRGWHPADVCEALMKVSDDLVGRPQRGQKWAPMGRADTFVTS